MAVEIEAPKFEMIPLGKIVSKLPVRRLSQSGLKRIQDSMRKLGFMENFPVMVAPLPDGTFMLVEGNHRTVTAEKEGISLIPCLVKYGLSEDEMYRLAIQSNSASGTVVPMTMVSYAEFVWERLAEKDEKDKKKYTQTDVAKMLGWSRDRVADHVSLEKIDKSAWCVIVATFENSEEAKENSSATKDVAIATNFSEGLLRSILDLTPEQQLELVQALANPDKDQRITKGKFTELAKAYQGRNEMKEHARAQLGELGEDYIKQLEEEIDSGAYDTEWQKSKDEKSKSFGEHQKLDKLIETIYAEWEQKNSIYLTHGDFYEEIKKVGDGKVDLILTDPPYNIANERKFTFDGRTSISQNFGEWDKYSREQFIEVFDTWAQEWKRILREGGSGYIFTSDIYLSYLIAALERAELDVKTSIAWHKTNPAPQMIQTTFQSTVEYIIFFVKGKDYTFNWQGNEGEMHNFIETPLCGGNERLQDAKKKTLHPTQKPIQVLKHLMEVSSNRGDTIFDGFAGVGSSGRAAKDLGRKFIGIEQDKIFFEAMQRRLADD
jgi:DNA modification methylase